MKKLARCAVLLAFALAFISCGNEGSKSSGGAKNLQAALNAGGDVNLDDYTVSSAGTYTVSKTTTITGDAKGAKFVIGGGADVEVTFNGTKQLGTLFVGSSASAAKSALPARAAETAGPKITLKGGVTVNEVFVYVVCTLNAEGNGNTFGDVVIADTVKSLALIGYAKVASLVALGDEITITISGDGVEIKKADKKAKEAAQKSKPNLTIDDIDAADLKDLEDAFENASKGDGKIISTKDELAEAVKGIIKAYYDFAQKVDERNSSRAVATATTQNDVAGQLKDVFDVIYGAYTKDALRDSIIKLFTGEGADKDIDLNAEIDLANVKPSVGMEAFIDLVNHGNGEMGEGKTNYTLQTYFGDDYPTVKGFLDVADGYASISELYALGKLNVNVNNKSNYASAEAKFNLAVDVDDINGMIPELFRAYNNNVHYTYVPTSANLPVTAVKPFIDLNAKVDLSKTEYDALVEVFKGANEKEGADVTDYLMKANYPGSYSGKISAGVSTTVMSSAKIPGGIITLSLDAKYNSPAQILALLNWLSDLTVHEESSGDEMVVSYRSANTESEYAKTLSKLKDDYGITPTVTVTDYNGKQTLKLELKDIIDVIDDVVKDIGEIIQ